MDLITERWRRIVATHVGSLPRPPSLSAKLLARMTGQNYDSKALSDELHQAVAGIVAKQAALGIDVVSDGEFSKTSFQYYVTDRLSGLEPHHAEGGRAGNPREPAFPTFYKGGSHSGTQATRYACTGPIGYVGRAQLAADIENFKAGARWGRAGRGVHAVGVAVELRRPDGKPLLQERRGASLCGGRGAAPEYLAIVDAGFMLQIDDPRLAMHYMLSPDETVAQTRAWAQRRIEALNHALRDIPPERVRHHTCYGINMGPRTSDIELKHFADLIVTIRAGYYSFEMANPRHEHEWRVWETVKLPEGKMLLPGCITQASVVVEHPELVAQRIIRLAAIVGREHVMASTDCGFASTLSATEPPEIEPEIVWAKLASLVEGARLASKTLWG